MDFGDSLQRGFDAFFEWLPNLIGAALIVLVGWLIARLVAGLVRRGLRALKTDAAVEQGTVGRYKENLAPTLKVSDLVATVAFWFVLGTAILIALSALQIPGLQAAIGEIVGYLPNVVAAILIVVVGVAISAAAGAIAQRLAGGTMLGRLVQVAVPAVVLSIAIAMALVQLEIAPSIVLATYVIVLGSLGLGLALAFGLGGREVASRMLESGYQSAREAAPQMRAEADIAQERARDEGRRVREEAEERVGGRPQERPQEVHPGAVPPERPYGTDTEDETRRIA
jgi:hypothetical protein